MAYTSFQFILLYPLVFLFYYCIPASWLRMRNIFLLLASYLLYMSWKPSYAVVLLLVTIVTYAGARLSENMRRSRLLLWGTVVLSILPLLIFKYLGFINDTLVRILSFIGLHVELPGLNWAIPIGISRSASLLSATFSPTPYSSPSSHPYSPAPSTRLL